MKEKKPNDGLNLALTLCVIFAVLFTICMIVLFCIYQSTPDVLIGAVFTALFGELGCCTLIYKVKYPKVFKDEDETEDTEEDFEYEVGD
jgi:hypothetical protein